MTLERDRLDVQRADIRMRYRLALERWIDYERAALGVPSIRASRLEELRVARAAVLLSNGAAEVKYLERNAGLIHGFPIP